MSRCEGCRGGGSWLLLCDEVGWAGVQWMGGEGVGGYTGAGGFPGAWASYMLAATIQGMNRQHAPALEYSCSWAQMQSLCAGHQRPLVFGVHTYLVIGFLTPLCVARQQWVGRRLFPGYIITSRSCCSLSHTRTGAGGSGSFQFCLHAAPKP